MMILHNYDLAIAGGWSVELKLLQLRLCLTDDAIKCPGGASEEALSTVY